MLELLDDLLDDLLAALLPARCPGCGRRAEPVCDQCAAHMRASPPALALPGVAWCTSVFAYEGVARELVARVKYRNERVAVRWLGVRLAAACHSRSANVDVVTWVPASASRRAARGVDHAALLARVVAATLGLPVERLLTRGAGPPQTGRAAAERRAGPPLTGTGRIAGRAVLVVDDVVTTGATLTRAASALHARGAHDVSAATVARTPRPGDRVRERLYTPTSTAVREHVSRAPNQR